MSKKYKQVSQFQKSRIISLINNSLKHNKEFDNNISCQDLFKLVSNRKIIHKFRTIGSVFFFKTKYDNMLSIMVFCILKFENKQKENIIINEELIKAIDFFESILIKLDDIKIERFEPKEMDKYYILFKAIRKVDPNILTILTKEQNE